MTSGTEKNGPERLTLIEKFFERIKLPFTTGCVLITILLSGPLAFIGAFVDTQDLNEAVRRTVTTTFSSSPQQTSFVAGFVGAVIYSILTFYSMYMTRAMRMKILRVESELIQLSPSGEKAYHAAFGRVSDYRPQLILAVPFILLAIPYYYGQIAAGYGVFFLFFSIVTNVAFGPILAGFVWVYFASLWGLHKFGKEPLSLKPHYEDALLGTRQTGSLALSLAFTYFAVIVLGTLGLLISPDPVGEAAVVALIVPGVLMFFLPLNSIHSRMADYKELEISSARKRTADLMRKIGDPQLDKPEDKLRGLGDVLALQLVKQDVTAIPTWPFDTRILGRFLAIILTVAGILLSRIIYNILIPF